MEDFPLTPLYLALSLQMRIQSETDANRFQIYASAVQE
jgi:hypothetical protein